MEDVKDAKLKELIKTTLTKWESGTFDVIASSKRNIFTVRDALHKLPMTPLYQPCRSWLRRWTNVFFNATFRLYQASYADFETVDGVITKETILEAIASE